MPNTERLNIPLVEENEQLSPELWNRAFRQIDSVCTRYEFPYSIRFPAGQSTVSISFNYNYQVIELIPAKPEDDDQWKAMSIANIRCYLQNHEGEKTLVLQAMGSVPDTDLDIIVLGWY